MTTPNSSRYAHLSAVVWQAANGASPSEFASAPLPTPPPPAVAPPPFDLSVSSAANMRYAKVRDFGLAAQPPPAAPPPDTSRAGVNELALWLKAFGLGDYFLRLREKEIAFDTFAMMKEEHFERLGFTWHLKLRLADCAQRAKDVLRIVGREALLFGVEIRTGPDGQPHVIGKGYYSQVFLARHEDLEIAAKLLRREDIAMFSHEVSTWAQLKNKFVVQLLGIYVDPKGEYMCSEYMDLGSLLSLLQRRQVAEHEYIEAAYDIARGMAYLEERKLVHRDLACRNMLCRREQSGKLVVKVADFGMTRSIGSVSEGADFNPNWASPEAIKGEFSTQSDVYSFGVCVWEIYADGATPYAEKGSKDRVIECILARELLPITATNQPVYDMLMSCWQQPFARPRFSELVREFGYRIATRPAVSPQARLAAAALPAQPVPVQPVLVDTMPIEELVHRAPLVPSSSHPAASRPGGSRLTSPAGSGRALRNSGGPGGATRPRLHRRTSSLELDVKLLSQSAALPTARTERRNSSGEIAEAVAFRIWPEAEEETSVDMRPRLARAPAMRGFLDRSAPVHTGHAGLSESASAELWRSRYDYQEHANIKFVLTPADVAFRTRFYPNPAEQPGCPDQPTEAEQALADLPVAPRFRQMALEGCTDVDLFKGRHFETMLYRELRPPDPAGAAQVEDSTGSLRQVISQAIRSKKFLDAVQEDNEQNLRALNLSAVRTTPSNPLHSGRVVLHPPHRSACNAVGSASFVIGEFLSDVVEQFKDKTSDVDSLLVKLVRAEKQEQERRKKTADIKENAIKENQRDSLKSYDTVKVKRSSGGTPDLDRRSPTNEGSPRSRKSTSVPVNVFLYKIAWDDMTERPLKVEIRRGSPTRPGPPVLSIYLSGTLPEAREKYVKDPARARFADRHRDWTDPGVIDHQLYDRCGLIAGMWLFTKGSEEFDRLLAGGMFVAVTGRTSGVEIQGVLQPSPRLALDFPNNAPVSPDPNVSVGLSDSITITNGSSKKVFFEAKVRNSNKFNLSMSPSSGKLEKGGQVTIKFDLIPLCTCKFFQLVQISFYWSRPGETKKKGIFGRMASSSKASDSQEEKGRLLVPYEFQSEVSAFVDFDELEFSEKSVVYKGNYAETCRGRWSRAQGEVAIKLFDASVSYAAQQLLRNQILKLSKLRCQSVVQLLGGTFVPTMPFAIVTEFVPSYNEDRTISPAKRCRYCGVSNWWVCGVCQGITCNSCGKNNRGSKRLSKIQCSYCKSVQDGTLLSLLNGRLLSDWLRLKIALDIARGLEFLHANELYHLNLKPSNIIVVDTSPNAKTVNVQICGLVSSRLTALHSRRVLTDCASLGSVDSLGESTRSDPLAESGNSNNGRSSGGPRSVEDVPTSRGIAYRAPESQEGPHADAYSFGMILYHIFSQLQPYSQPPFNKMRWHEIRDWVVSGKRLEMPATFPPGVADLIQRCWHRIADERPPFTFALNSTAKFSATIPDVVQAMLERTPKPVEPLAAAPLSPTASPALSRSMRRDLSTSSSTSVGLGESLSDSRSGGGSQRPDIVIVEPPLNESGVIPLSASRTSSASSASSSAPAPSNALRSPPSPRSAKHKAPASGENERGRRFSSSLSESSPPVPRASSSRGASPTPGGQQQQQQQQPLQQQPPSQYQAGQPLTESLSLPDYDSLRSRRSSASPAPAPGSARASPSPSPSGSRRGSAETDTMIPVPRGNYSLVGWCFSMSRDEAEARLRDTPEGTFLVRWSAHTHSYVLSYVRRRNQIQHVGHIEPIGDDRTRIQVLQSNGGFQIFDDIYSYCSEMQQKGVIRQPIPVDFVPVYDF